MSGLSAGRQGRGAGDRGGVGPANKPPDTGQQGVWERGNTKGGGGAWTPAFRGRSQSKHPCRKKITACEA